MNHTAIEARSDRDVLQGWVDLLGASVEAVRNKFAHSRFHYDPDSVYGSLTNVALLSNKDALFYFDRARLILIHLHSKSILAKLDGRSLLSDLGSPEADLRSRAGKGYSQYVFPARGIAFASDSEGRVAFVEIFQPMSLAEYLAQIYIDPGQFEK
jgi:hypothetical protein